MVNKKCTAYVAEVLKNPLKFVYMFKLNIFLIESASIEKRIPRLGIFYFIFVVTYIMRIIRSDHIHTSPIRS